MKVTCPKCESEDVQRLAVIYQLGTATSVGTASTLADVGGHLGVGGTVVSGRQQSLLAQQAAPPQLRQSSGCLLVTGIILLVFGFLALAVAAGLTPYDRDTGWTLGGVMVLLGGILFVSARASVRANEEYNRTTYPRLKEQWDRTWLCMRCGNRFEASL